MRLGNLGGKNKGKKYLKIRDNEIITNENRIKASHFARWFSANYEKLRRELIAKGTPDEDLMNETYLKIYEKIVYGGLEINNYKAYFHRAFFTNFIQSSIRKSELNHITVSEEYAIEIYEEEYNEEDVNREKARLFDEIISFIKNCYDPPVYEVFIRYLKIGERSYQPVCTEFGLARDTVINIINKVRLRVRHNKHLMSKRKSM